MLTIQIKNKHICFYVELVFNTLDPRLITHLWELLSVDSEDETVQTVSIPSSEFLTLYKGASVQMEGVAAAINAELKSSILPQLIAASTLTMSQVGYIVETLEAPEGIELNEAGTTILEIAKTDKFNKDLRESKIARGKSLILKPYV